MRTKNISITGASALQRAPDLPVGVVSSSAPASGDVLSVRDLVVELNSKQGKIRVVDGVTFDVGASETLAILGESGSGKSVTGLAIMGLLAKRAAAYVGGSVVLDGVNLLECSPSEIGELRAQGIALVFQDALSALNPTMRVGDQIGELFRRRRGFSRSKARAAAVGLMEKVGIPDAASRARDYPHQLSGGMRQRVVIAMAVALEPRVLIADEPTTALDVTVQAQIMDLLATLQRDYGMAMLLISHDLGVVADVADRVAVMYAGRIVEYGPLRQVYDSPSHPYTRGLLESIPRMDLEARHLSAIPGSPPPPSDKPPGCAFAARCSMAVDLCREQEPVLREVGAAHSSACHFAKEVGGI